MPGPRNCSPAKFVDIGVLRNAENIKTDSIFGKLTKGFWKTLINAVKELSLTASLGTGEEDSYKLLNERVDAGLCFLGHRAKTRNGTVCYELVDGADDEDSYED